MGRAALSFLSGLASGYTSGTEAQKKQAREDAELAIRQQQADRQQAEADRADRDRTALANAVRPAAVNQNAATLDLGDGTQHVYDAPGVDPATMNSAAGSDLRQANRLSTPGFVSQTTDGASDQGAAPDQSALPAASLGQAIAVGGKAYATLGDAKTAADAQNSPDAVNARIDAAGVSDPMKSLALKQAITKDQREGVQYQQSQVEYAKKLRQEGGEATAKAMLTGNANTVFDTFNAQGKVKLKAPPTVQAQDIDIPGIGKVKNYIYTGTVVNPDGTEQPITVDSHSANMGLMKYKDVLDTLRKGSDSEQKAKYQEGLLDNKIKQLELTGQIAEARALAAASKNGGPATREERIRYTSLFSDAGRRLGEAQKALITLQKDPDFQMRLKRKPDGAERQQLDSLQSDVQTYRQDREMYQGLLAGSQSPSGKAPALSDAKPAGGGPVKVTSKAQRDALPKGTRYTGPDGQQYTKQ